MAKQAFLIHELIFTGCFRGNLHISGEPETTVFTVQRLRT